jgi:anti-sigma regulatory factor (Ser/Thr protein kinase)
VTETLAPFKDHELAVDAAIVTGELAANAVMHAHSGFAVAVWRSPSGVRISVRDGSTLRPVTGPTPFEVNHGHGLWVVAQIAQHWAVEWLPGGKVVWAELLAPEV